MKKTIIWILVLILILSISFVAIGCKEKEVQDVSETEEVTTNEETTDEEETSEEVEESVQSYKVGYLTVGLSHPYLTELYTAFKAVIEDAGHEVILFDPELDPAVQDTQMDDALAMKVDIIDLNALSVDSIGSALKKAYDEGVPVLANHNRVLEEDQKYTIGYAGPDNYLEGLVAGEYMNTLLDGKGKIVIIEGTPGFDASDGRKKGFLDKLEELGSEIEVLAVQPGNFNKAEATAVMEDFLVRFPDIDAVYGIDDNHAMGAWVAIEEAGIEAGEIKIVGIGGSKEGLAAIDSGIMSGTVSQQPSDGGKWAAKFILEALNNGIKPPNQLDPYFNYLETPIVTKENVAGFLPGEW